MRRAHHRRSQLHLLMMVAALAMAACKGDPAPAPPPKPAFPIAQQHAYEVALTLAALRDAKADGISDLELVQRHRPEIGFSLSVQRRYTIAKAASPAMITRDELRHALHVETQGLAEGKVVELPIETPHLGLVIAALLDEQARVLDRTRALTGAEAAMIREQLRTQIGLDLDTRTLGGTPWTNTQGVQSWWAPTIVEKITEPSAQISVRDATALDPAARAGRTLTLRAQLTLSDAAPRFHAAPALEVEVFADDFESLRSLARPIGTMDNVPLFGFYREKYGVQYIEVPRGDAMALWNKLDAEAATSALHPLVFAGTAKELTQARLAWRTQEPLMMQAAMHPADSPAAALAAIGNVDVKALLKPGGNPSYPDHRPARGPMRPVPKKAPLDPFVEPDSAQEYRVILLVQTDAAWKGPAFVRGFHDAGEATPSLAQAAAVSRHFETTYGARLAAIGPAKLTWWLTRTLSRTEAIRLATELLVFAPDAYDGTVEDVAAQLLADGFLSAWWD